MASYTCLTCRVAFQDAEVQRAHYKGDWHRYNLKRKVAAMAPVTAENFQARLAAQAAGAEQDQGAASASASYCGACGKRFSNYSAYENHLRSRKHLELERRAAREVSRQVGLRNEKNREKGLEAAAATTADKDAVNAAIQQAVKGRPSDASPRHAAVAAGQADRRQPPRARWLQRQAQKLARDEQDHDDDDDEGWEDIDSDEDVESEDEQVEGSSEAPAEREVGPDPFGPEAIPPTDCLFCSHHSSSLMKNVAHMTKVHSFFIPDIEYLVDLRGLIKYLGEKVGSGKICLWCNEKGKSFYSTESVQAHMKDKSHCKLFTEGDAALEFADFYDFRSSYPDYQEGEDVEMSKELPSEKNLEYDDESMELILPSGARIGHRSLMRYYKQRFGSSQALAVGKNKQRVGRVVQQYKALGWTSSTGAALSRERDMQYLQRMKAKWMLKTGMQNNTTKQMHFRMQVRF